MIVLIIDKKDVFILNYENIERVISRWITLLSFTLNLVCMNEFRRCLKF
jgi:hypothetical protein